MGKYRKKPVIIDAVEWDGENFKEIKRFAGTAVHLEEMASGGKKIVVETLESEKEMGTRHAASVGDFIIKGVEGEFYPCKPDIFHKTYDKA